MDTHGLIEEIEYRMEHSNEDERIAMTVMIIILLLTTVLCCYLCLKNRGKICKRGGSIDGPAVPPELPGVN